MARHYAVPARDDYGGGNPASKSEIEDEEEPSKDKWDQAKGGDQQTPEVAASIALECGQTYDYQFHGIVPGNRREYCNNIRLELGDASRFGLDQTGVRIGRHEDIMFLEFKELTGCLSRA